MDKMNLFTELSEDDKIRQADKEFFIQYNHVECGGDKSIVEFIANFRFFAVRDVEYVQSSETICSMFEKGYCYYFAKILEEAFPGGTICLCYPYGHIVYVHKEVAYDIGGVSDAEAEYYVPISVVGRGTHIFKHVPGPAVAMTELEKDDIKHYCEETGGVYALYDCLPCKQAVQRCRGIVFGSDDPEIRKQRETLETLKRDLRTRRGRVDFGQNMTIYCVKNDLSWELIKRLRNEYIDQLRKEARCW